MTINHFRVSDLPEHKAHGTEIGPAPDLPRMKVVHLDGAWWIPCHDLFTHLSNHYRTLRYLPTESLLRIQVPDERPRVYAELEALFDAPFRSQRVRARLRVLRRILTPVVHRKLTQFMVLDGTPWIALTAITHHPDIALTRNALSHHMRKMDPDPRIMHYRRQWWIRQDSVIEVFRHITSDDALPMITAELQFATLVTDDYKEVS